MTIEQRIPPQNTLSNNNYRDEVSYERLHTMSDQEISDHINMKVTCGQPLQEIPMSKYWQQNPNTPWILFLHDSIEEQEKKGGIGKTRLLKKCQDIARQQRQELAIASIDFFNVGDCNSVVVVERIIEALQATFLDWAPTFFLDAIDEHRDVHKPESIDDITKVRRALFKALTTDLQYLDCRLTKKQKIVLVFYDTYESIEQNSVIAVLRFSQTFPDTWHFEHMYTVVAGCNALDWTHPNWRGREQAVQAGAPTPFSQQGMVECIDCVSFYDRDRYSEQTMVPYEHTEGRPILIGLATDVLNKHTLMLEHLAAIPSHDFEPHLLMQINNLEHPLNWIILFMAHAYHRFNQKILNWFLQEADRRRLLQAVQWNKSATNVSTLSFVRKPGHGEDFVLHDEMRRLVVKCYWESVDPDKHRYRNRSRGIIDSSSRELEQKQNKLWQQLCDLMKLLFIDSSIPLTQRKSIRRYYKEYLLLDILNVLAQIRKESDPLWLCIHLSGLQKTNWSQIWPSSSIRAEQVWKDKIKIRLKATHILLLLLLINLNYLASENLTVLRNGVLVRLSRETNILLTDGKPITKWNIEEAFFQSEHKPILALYRLFCYHLRNEKQEQLAVQSFEMKKSQTRIQEALEQ